VTKTSVIVIAEKLWAPLFLDNLQNFDGIEDGRAQFSCKVNGKPAPEIVW